MYAGTRTLNISNFPQFYRHYVAAYLSKALTVILRKCLATALYCEKS